VVDQWNVSFIFQVLDAAKLALATYRCEIKKEDPSILVRWI